MKIEKWYEPFGFSAEALFIYVLIIGIIIWMVLK